MSFSLGVVAGVATVAGLAILIYRRRTVGSVFSATTRNDKIMYVLLGVTLLLGLAVPCTATSPAIRTITATTSRPGSGRCSTSTRTRS